MNSLEDPCVANTLQDLHRRAAGDWTVFARALPRVLGGVVTGKGFMESAKPYLKDAYIPIRREQGLTLYQLARMRRARNIVEFGASFGISTIYLASAVRDNGGGTVITTEIEPGKAAAARANFARAGLSNEIELREGDALETLRRIDGPIDMLFLDGWKEACLSVLRLLGPALPPGACILCDDVRPFRKTLKPYVDYVRSDPNRYVSMELPLGDGLELSVVV